MFAVRGAWSKIIKIIYAKRERGKHKSKTIGIEKERIVLHLETECFADAKPQL